MKYVALAWVIEYYLTIGIVWFFIVAASYLLTKKAKPDVRTSTLILAVASVPLYFWLGLDVKYHQYIHEKNLKQHRAIADKSSQLYKKICAEKPAINVKKVVQNATPIDIRVVEANRHDHLKIAMDPSRACWFSKYGTRCKRSNIRSIEWSQDDFSSSKLHFFRFSAIGIQNTNGFSSQYSLNVLTEKIDPLINKYSVSIRNVETGQVLAETNIYQKSYFYGRSTDGEMKEPRYCPEVDVHLADMLSQVFPVPPPRVKNK